ncbi:MULTISPECIES: NAD-dependent succinate-semialdehyde dehydrogenase [unclassified Mesorhizobium]|uniref:NAD-dependent succinate-semialdehyde dehydrogenase n=1 Tax=unclassified Mesorhizobium TaxID=325217 RepID=UPI000FDCC462|nr:MULTISPECIES: NAD-dependent succinate-semialdehyde dehydrogenase [unclassified Mesorhizobium]TGR22983.1 NAD-dependent succinate-semialdehyde dehydrogenase [Mesorhizobium sp. M8A.F.Ca.ET.197.01.1.1]TGR39066.1 NAD-dependent succinate-semialdehyde dehydrogenase [bacterium M00.F.Ca.ET.199.01.1.1]TGR46661.1 NAD-dependent succinate-semialdehyde dehydrogenase [Mesorhizobium sp. M8A.F.Ca.ET.198.01.1.1]TGV85265.1 NAD-dependent succinate-semialdehyde dehydrogenase [Mesorhizobium sp. M00.F.Ca.ET.149.01
MSDKPNHPYPPIGLLIDGEWIYDRPALCDVENPSDESILGQVPKATAKDLQNALESSTRGFEVWRRTPPTERAAIMRRAAGLVRERAADIAPIFTMELGKTLSESLAEIERSATFLDWDAEEIRRLYGRIVPTDPPIQQFVVREPIGPVAAFTPWNVPMSAPSRKISASLAAGCSVILKPAEETPATACLFAQCFLDAGLPKGVLNVVFGDPDEVSRTLVLSPITRLVTLTGSINVGKHLTRLAAETMKPVLMELGGHAPVLVDENVDPDAIAQLAVNWKYRMAGQFCSAPSRFLVHRSVYSDFVESLASKASRLVVGDGFAKDTQMGPVANRRRLDAMSGLVEDAVAYGARVVTGGQRVGNRGWFYAPTVLADVPLDARIMKEEPFGPLSPCAPVDSMDEALSISNSLDMGLAAFVFTNSMERADHLSRELQVGSVALNVFTSPGADAPFGGYRESGIGREGGLEMWNSYTVSKTIAERRVRV